MADEQTPSVEAPKETTEAAPQERSTTIPRDRFDEVNNEKNALKAKVDELEQQATYQQYQQPQADMFGQQQPAQQQYQQPAIGQQPAYGQPQAVADPNDQQSQQLGYQNWNQHFQTDPNGAMKQREQQRELSQSTQGIVNMQNQFANEWFQKKPDLADPYKRSQDPEYQEFNKIVQSNPYAKLTRGGLVDAVELAKSRVASRNAPETAQAQQQAGAQQEQQRMVQSETATAVVGGGTTPQVMPGTQPITLSPMEEKYRSRTGMSIEQWQANKDKSKGGVGDAGRSVLRKEVRSVRPSQQPPQPPTAA